MDVSTFRRRLEEECEHLDLESALLAENAVSVISTIDRLESVVNDEGETTRGSKGQNVLHPAVRELRMQRQALARTLQLLFAPPEAKDFRARQSAAANARWHPGGGSGIQEDA